MPRDPSKRAGYRQAVESNINAPGLAVAARPNAIATPRNDYRPQVSTDAALIADSLRGLVPALSLAAKQNVQAKAERDFQAGQAARLKATEEDLKNKDALVYGQTPEYVRGFNYQSGKAGAARDSADMQLEYEALKDTFVTPGQYDKWASEWLATRMQGVDDPDLLQGYLETISNTDSTLRQKNAENNFNASRAKIRDDFNTSLRSDLQGAAANGASAQELHTIARSYYDQGALMGLSKEEVNELLFTNIWEAAIETERPELFDVFEISSSDVDNPEQTIPGLANSPKWQERIVSARNKAESVAESKQSEQKQKEKYQYGKTIQGYVDKGDYPKAIEEVEKGVGVYYNSSEAEARVAQIKKHQAAELKGQMIDKALTAGPAATGPLLASGTATRKDLQDRFDQQSLKRMIEAGDDPIKQRQAMEMNIADARRNGLDLTVYGDTLNNANPDNPQQFQSAAKMFSMLHSIDPKYADSQIKDDNQAARFRIYNEAIHYGYDEQTALDMASRSGGKEDEERLRKQWSSEWNSREAEETIDDKLLYNTDAPWFGENADAADRAYFQNTIEEMAYLIFRQSGGRITKEKALDMAIERFANTHEAVRLPTSDEGGEPQTVWVWNAGQPLPPNFADAQQHMSDGLKDVYKGTPDYDPAGYFLVPAGKGRYTIMGVSLRRPVRAGANKEATIGLQELMGAYDTKDEPTDEETKSGFQANKESDLNKQQMGPGGFRSTPTPEARAKAEEKEKARQAENARKYREKEKQLQEGSKDAGKGVEKGVKALGNFLGDVVSGGERRGPEDVQQKRQRRNRRKRPNQQK